MNEHLKKRLVGALVLVALAVIFVPMLQEKKDVDGHLSPGEAVLPPPEIDLPVLDIPLREVPVVAGNGDAPAAASATHLSPGDAEGPPAGQGAERRKDEPEMASAVPIAPVAEVKPVRAAEIAPIKPVDGAADLPGDTASWTVQVGSFSTQENAGRLRDRLRGQGYPAYIEQSSPEGKVTYRVRVGPVLNRSDAESIRTKLQQLDLQGIIMPHP